MAVTHRRGLITYHTVTIRESITRDVIAAAVDAKDRDGIDAGYRCLAAWRLGRKAPREDWALVKMFADMD